MDYVLFNPFSGNNSLDTKAKEVIEKFEIENPIILSVIDLDYCDFLTKLTANDRVIICGGDGTINKAANVLYGKDLPCAFYVYKSGIGNDFLTDVQDCIKNDLLYLNDFIKVLPKVIVNGQETRFINGIGFGIDGEACRVADEKKKRGVTKVNYASISINLLLFHFKTPIATVEIDDQTYTFKNVYLASTMKGKYYGGGMKIAPTQDRMSGKLSFAVFKGKNKLGTLMKFPSLFKGEQVKYKKAFELIEGKHIKVTFSHPCALQIDGETVLNVTSYEVFAD